MQLTASSWLRVWRKPLRSNGALFNMCHQRLYYNCLLRGIWIHVVFTSYWYLQRSVRKLQHAHCGCVSWNTISNFYALTSDLIMISSFILFWRRVVYDFDGETMRLIPNIALRDLVVKTAYFACLICWCTYAKVTFIWNCTEDPAEP